VAEKDNLANNQVFEFEFQGKKLIFEIDKLASKSGRSVLCRYGNTTVLTTLTSVSSVINRFSDFLHLTVFLEERFYSIGKFPGNFGRREGKPSEEAIKAARRIDRTLRSFFCKGITDDIQITNVVLSVDKNCDPRIVAC